LELLDEIEVADDIEGAEEADLEEAAA